MNTYIIVGTSGQSAPSSSEAQKVGNGHRSRLDRIHSNIRAAWGGPFQERGACEMAVRSSFTTCSCPPCPGGNKVILDGCPRGNLTLTDIRTNSAAGWMFRLERHSKIYPEKTGGR